MSEQESNVCAICGGVKRVDWTVSFVDCHPVEVRFTPESLANNWRLCPGHPEPAQKHDGNLGGGDRISYNHYYRRPVHVQINVCSDEFDITDDMGEIAISPRKALSLLDWLRQEEAELQRLAKEQERG